MSTGSDAIGIAVYTSEGLGVLDRPILAQLINVDEENIEYGTGGYKVVASEGFKPNKIASLDHKTLISTPTRDVATEFEKPDRMLYLRKLPFRATNIGIQKLRHLLEGEESWDDAYIADFRYVRQTKDFSGQRIPDMHLLVVSNDGAIEELLETIQTNPNLMMPITFQRIFQIIHETMPHLKDSSYTTKTYTLPLFRGTERLRDGF